MKKIMLSITLLLFAVSGYCQYGKPVKLDSLVTVSLPAGYQVKDTLGNRIFSVNGMFGYITVIRQPNAKNNKPLNKASDLNKELKAALDLHRMFLHAWRLVFPHPTSGKSLTIESPLPEDLEDCLLRASSAKR